MKDCAQFLRDILCVRQFSVAVLVDQQHFILLVIVNFPERQIPSSIKAFLSLSLPCRSVSGKKLCSSCGQPLGKGAAMIIETLSLYFHIHCFKVGVEESAQLPEVLLFHQRFSLILYFILGFFSSSVRGMNPT